MKLPRYVLTLALVLGLAACASSGGMNTDGDGGNGIAVEVQNNLVPPTSLTIWLVSRSTGRRMLGTVSPRETSVVEADAAEFGGEYQLLAETTAGSEVLSRPFVVPESTTSVSWDLTSNMVSVSTR